MTTVTEPSEVPWECGDCGDLITPGDNVFPRFHLNDGSPQCMGRADAAKRKPPFWFGKDNPGYFGGAWN